MLAMRLAGETYASIGRKANVSRQRVQQLIDPLPYIKDLVFKRAEGKCQRCGIFMGRSRYDSQLSGHIHHVGNPEEDYNDTDNLLLLCPSCHRFVHGEMAAIRQVRVMVKEILAEVGIT